MKKLILALTFAFAPQTFAQAVPDWLAEQVFNKLDEHCAGNNNGSISRFNVAKFDANKAKKKLLSAAGECKGMKASQSKDEAVDAFISYLQDSKDDFTQCMKENLTDAEQRVIVYVVRDLDNLGVYSNQYDGGDESEACYFHHFDIYRASGQKISIVHDETD